MTTGDDFQKNDETLIFSAKTKLDTEVILKNNEYALILIRGKSKKTNVEFSLYLAVTNQQLKSINEASKNNSPLNISQYKENFVYEKKGHYVSEDEHANALEYFAKHYSGNESKRKTLKTTSP